MTVPTQAKTRLEWATGRFDSTSAAYLCDIAAAANVAGGPPFKLQEPPRRGCGCPVLRVLCEGRVGLRHTQRAV
jgi:hypothetical protein